MDTKDTSPKVNTVPTEEPSSSDSSVESEVNLLCPGLNGLTSEKASHLLMVNGPNATPEPHESLLKKLSHFFIGPIPILIEIAAILSAALESWADFGIITALLFVNALIGFYEEKSAGDAVAALKSQIPNKCAVKRDGTWRTGETAELVVGDLVSVKIGDRVPADGVLIRAEGSGGEEKSVSFDQAALTGESRPVKRMRFGKVLSSSIVKEGEGEIIVTKTGADTFIGKAATLVATSQPSGHFQKVLKSIGNFLITCCFVCIAVILAYGLSNGYSAGNLITFCLVLAIASIPIALPAVMSSTMAVGAHQLSKRKAVVTALTAVEEMAALDILCSDKTGTLTKNELDIDELLPMPPFTPADVITYGGLACKNSTTKNRTALDAIDTCILGYVDRKHEQVNDPAYHHKGEHSEHPNGNGRSGAVDHTHSIIIPPFDSFTQKSMRPFDPVLKRCECAIKENSTGKEFIVSKGAPQVMFNLANAKDKAKLNVMWERKINEMARKGLRALGVAMKDEQKSDWRLVGLISLLDPPRDDSKATIDRLHQLGVSVKMVTGDQTAIAQDTAIRLGMHPKIANAVALREEKKSIEEEEKMMESLTGEKKATAKQRVKERMIELMSKVFHSDGFAEVWPEDKHFVVKLLQRRGDICGMTGDGVNDAPALKQSNVGIAVSGASDAARSAADLVLLEPGLSVIADAIVESRKIFARMNAYAYYRCIATMTELIFLTLSILIWDFVLPPFNLVLVAVFNDFTVVSIAWDRQIPSAKPVDWNMKMIIGKTFVLGTYMFLMSLFYLFLVFDYFELDSNAAASLVFLELSTGTQLTLFSTRVNRGSFFSMAPSLLVFVCIIGTQIVAGMLAAWGGGMAAVGWTQVALTWCFAIGQLLIFDVLKQLVDIVIDQHRWDRTDAQKLIDEEEEREKAIKEKEGEVEVEMKKDDKQEEVKEEEETKRRSSESHDGEIHLHIDDVVESDNHGEDGMALISQ